MCILGVALAVCCDKVELLPGCVEASLRCVWLPGVLESTLGRNGKTVFVGEAGFSSIAICFPRMGDPLAELNTLGDMGDLLSPNKPLVKAGVLGVRGMSRMFDSLGR